MPVNLSIKDQTNRFTRFYPLDLCGGLMEMSFNYEKEDDIPEQVYGKYVMSWAGYNPVWAYVTVPKSKLKIG